MNNELYFEEWTIEWLRDGYDRLGNQIKNASIGRKTTGSQIPLYENDLVLLKKILGCDDDKFDGKNITAVNQQNITRAIGYQGLYIPLYYRDGSSRIVSEGELCELLNSSNVIRINKDGNLIVRYEVPIRNTINKRSL